MFDCGWSIFHEGPSQKNTHVPCSVFSGLTRLSLLFPFHIFFLCCSLSQGPFLWPLPTRRWCNPWLLRAITGSGVGSAAAKPILRRAGEQQERKEGGGEVERGINPARTEEEKQPGVGAGNKREIVFLLHSSVCSRHHFGQECTKEQGICCNTFRTCRCFGVLKQEGVHPKVIWDNKNCWKMVTVF